MTTEEESRPPAQKNQELDPRPEGPPSPGVSRRGFLGGIAAAAVVGGASPASAERLEPELSGAGADFARGDLTAVPPGDLAARRERSYRVRQEAALHHRQRALVPQVANGDDERYAERLGSFTKGLPHDAHGEVDPHAYDTLLQALGSGDPDDFERIRLAGGRRLVNPQGGLAADLEGYDASAVTAPPAPALASAELAGEAVELYWMALLRDVSFLDYHQDEGVAAAVAELGRLEDFRGPRRLGVVNAQSLFRDPLPGCLVGPYVSQFLWKPTPYGAEYVERRMRTVPPGSDWMTTWSDWLDVQNGFGYFFYPHDESERRFIRTARDLAEWVHVDQLYQAYFNACLILTAPPDPFDRITEGGIGCPPGGGNPYNHSLTQHGFTTFGDSHVKALLAEVSTRALKATWYQKWFVHRRLRPEALGGLVHLQRTEDRYDGLLHRELLESQALDRAFSQHGTYLLPQAYPEGSPVHPSYTAGHATVAGACVTILKAMYKEDYPIFAPVVPTPDGRALQPYQGPQLTVGGELNKLASNVATGRNLAGIHWRTDALASLRLGEQIAIGVLRDQRDCYNERFGGFTFTRFDGTKITV